MSGLIPSLEKADCRPLASPTLPPPKSFLAASRYFCEPGITFAIESNCPALSFSCASCNIEPVPPVAWVSLTPSCLVSRLVRSGALPVIDFMDSQPGSSAARIKIVAIYTLRYIVSPPVGLNFCRGRTTQRPDAHCGLRAWHDVACSGDHARWVGKCRGAGAARHALTTSAGTRSKPRVAPSACFGMLRAT